MDKNITYSRTQLHESAMICIYQYLLYSTLKKDYRKHLPEIVSDLMHQSFDECDEFFKAIIFLCIKNRNEYIEVISKYLAEKWRFNRLSLVEQAILLLFSSEIMNHQVETNIAIDVSVDLAKRYCDENAYKYINAVLDKIGKEYA